MRRVLEADATTPLGLGDEIGYVRSYLEIEQLRFAGRLHVTWDVDEGCEHLRVPPFAVQTLVENAVQHGIGPKMEPGRITIKVRRSARHAVVAVKDDGMGMTTEERRAILMNRDGDRVHGLQILTQQLVLMFDRQARLRVFSRTDAGTLAAFVLPISSMTALIVDDEPMARAHLRRLLEAQRVEIVGEAENAVHALELAEDLRPELIFLDIQMPVLTGMQMASALLHQEPAPLIVFVTGYSEHAVAAFEHEALDYLLKPVAPDRIARTLVRARERLGDAEGRRQTRERVLQRAAEGPLRRLPVRGDYVVRLIRVEEIICAVAREKRVFVRTKDDECRTYYTLTQLEALLPADQFLRIHDSVLVNLERVEELLFLGNHAYQVRLSDKQCLPVGRTRYAELRRRLGLEEVSPP
jgi:DNA-binding LytR/AlgR family response regulator